MPDNGPRRWGDKRYNNINHHLRRQFGEKIGKVTLDGGFTCPNRDGTLARGGCSFCSAAGSGDFIASQGQSLAEQYQQGREVLRNKWGADKFIAYLQSFTNTYAPVGRLREVYYEALYLPGVIGLNIATRPDCLPEEVLDLLEEIGCHHSLTVELGLQTIHESTAQGMNLQYDYNDFQQAVEKLRARHIDVCAHIILGLPGEEREEMMATAQAVAHQPVQGIKIQLLHLLRDAPLAQHYAQHPFPFLSREEYVERVADILEILPPEIVIHRLTGDGPRKLLIGPLWSLDKRAVINAIDGALALRDSWQGKFYR